MGKKKLSSNVLQKRKKRANVVPLVNRNRFEVHVNRSKHNILGKKDKNDRGLPGISRLKANEKRKKTLLVEYKQRNKTNTMVDKRFGEFDETVTPEEKMLKRFMLEKQSHHVKSGYYNIGDDEELTHYGQSLANISNFDEIELDLSGDEDNHDMGNVFGGLLTKKGEGDQTDVGEQKLSRQEIMREIIVDSKRDKQEKHKTKELAFELTQRLDTEWKQIQPMLIKHSVRNNNTTTTGKQDDYDKTVNELLFEAKGKPTERLKSVEETVKEEKKKQDKMTKEQILRMEIVDEEDSIHQSADALIKRLPKKVDDRYELKYRDGQMVKPEGFDDALKENENGSEDEDESGDDDDDDTDTDTENEDVFSDDEFGEASVDKTGNEKDDTATNTPEDVQSGSEPFEVEVTAKKTKLKRKERQKDVSEDKSPYNFKVPDNLEVFLKKLQDSELEITELLHKVRRINIGSKKKLGKLFDILLEYIDHLCNLSGASIKSINNLPEFIQLLVQDIPMHVTKSIQARLKTMFGRITLCIKQRCYLDIFPTLSEIALFKIIELVFPTSDMNHVITTPCLYIMALILTSARVTNIKCVLSGILLIDVIYDYVKLSRRYLPELITFLAKLFYLAAPVDKPIKIISSSILNLQKSECGLLVVGEGAVPTRIKISLLASSYGGTSLENDSFKLSCIYNLLNLTKRFCELYIEKETFNDIFTPVSSLLERLPVETYPAQVSNLHCELVILMQSKATAEKAPLKLQTRKPIPLTLLEPEFDEDIDNTFRKHGGSNKEKNEHDKLKYKVKKEMKGALREIRKDTHYLAKQQLGEKLQKDATRKRKVKELHNALENEKREIREMEKGSKSKR